MPKLKKSELADVLFIAWQQGYTSGHSRAMRKMSDEPNVEDAKNPYRDNPTSSDDRDSSYFYSGWKAALKEVVLQREHNHLDEFLTEQSRVMEDESV